eukprot:SM000201S05915  [mRNA]  locus=s201:67813:71195:- [translate_table: standard]
MQPPSEGHAQEGEAQPPEPAVANRVPPGFRFHPTDEELVWHYLRPKVAGRGPDFPIFGEIEIYNHEPWDLPVLGVGGEHQSYFFTHRKRKYPGGHRAKRTTEAGYWKATGKDRPVYRGRTQIGMMKTLVYHLGRAPNGEKMDWVMNEYRLMEHDEAATSSRADLSTAPFWVVIRIHKKKAKHQEGSEDPGEASSRGARAASPLSDGDDGAPDPATHEVKVEPVAETASLGPVGRAVTASSPLVGLLQDPGFQSRAASQTPMQAVASSPSKPTSSWAWHTTQPLVSTLTSGPLQASTSTDVWQPQANSAGAQQTLSSGTSSHVQPTVPSQLQASTRLSAQVGEPDQAPAAASGGLAYLQAVRHMQLQQVAAAALDDSDAQQLRHQLAMAMQTQGGLMDILQGGGQAQPHNSETTLGAAAGSAEGQPWLDPAHEHLIKLHNLVNSCAMPPITGSAGSMGHPPRLQLQQQSTPHSYLRQTLAMLQNPLQLQRLPLDTFALAAQRILAQGLAQQGGCKPAQYPMAETLTLITRPDAHALHREQYLPSLHNVQPEDDPNRQYNFERQIPRENQMLTVNPLGSNQLFAQQAQPAAELVLDTDKVEASSPKNVVTLGGDLAFPRPTCGALEAVLGSAGVHGHVHLPSWLTAQGTPTLHDNMKRQLHLPPCDTYTQKASPSRSPLCISTIEEGAREDSDTLLQHDDEVSSMQATPLPCTFQQVRTQSTS